MAGSHRSSVQEGIPLKRNDAKHVCLERVLVELSIYMGMAAFDMLCCHLCPELVLAKSSVYIGNGWLCDVP